MVSEQSRASWEEYTPQTFIDQVLHGSLNEKVRMTATVVHVYTHVVLHIPETETIRLTSAAPGDDLTMTLRDAFVMMRWNASEMADVMHGDSVTLPAPYTPAIYIASMVRGLKDHALNLRQCASALESDPIARRWQRRFPNGKTACEAAEEILGHAAEIVWLLNVAHRYVDKIKTRV